ncbi:MAG: DDE-type integrase/transposase/recombinase [Solirubrobacteraceae bacterium]|jgi:putative transposase
MDADRRRDVGLFRYSMVRDVASMSPGQRGLAVRELAAREHLTPWGEWVRVSRVTLDRWVRAWREGGFEALVPAAREGVPRTDQGLLELAVALKREAPERTAAQIVRIIGEREGSGPAERTIQRHFVRVGLNVRPSGQAVALGRFEAQRPNELWIGDALHGPVVAARKAILFCFIDDHSRLLPGYRWGTREDVLRLEGALRRGLTARGVPDGIYVDNGSPFVSGQLLRCCAVLGARLVHSRPGRPQGRGKIERVFATVRGQFLVEINARGGVADLDELNRLFSAWVEQVYHRRVHSETGQAPIERFLCAGAPALPSEDLVREAFLWAEQRTATRQATVTVHGNHYEIDPALARRRVELIFDPLDMERVEVRFQGRSMGMAVPRQIRRHVHPRASADPGAEQEPKATGIDYLGLIEARRREQLERRIDYRTLGDSEASAADGGDPEHDQHEEDSG